MSSESLPSEFENFDEYLAFSVPTPSPFACTLAQDYLAILEGATSGEETQQGTLRLSERSAAFNSIVDPEDALRDAPEFFEIPWTGPTESGTDPFSRTASTADSTPSDDFSFDHGGHNEFQIGTSDAMLQNDALVTDAIHSRGRHSFYKLFASTIFSNIH